MVENAGRRVALPEAEVFEVLCKLIVPSKAGSPGTIHVYEELAAQPFPEVRVLWVKLYERRVLVVRPRVDGRRLAGRRRQHR